MMFNFFYNLLWCLLLLLIAPVYVYRLLFTGKYRHSTVQRLGMQTLPKLAAREKSVWLHSVSLGESQISDQFAKALKQKSPTLIISASTCTETGFKVLSESQYIDYVFYYPADFSFLIEKIFKAVNPNAIFIMETDLWPSLLNLADKFAVPVFLINGKISQSTFDTYRKFPWLKKLLLDPIDKLYVQCAIYKRRFELLGIQQERMLQTGNIKLDRSYAQKTEQQKQAFINELGLNSAAPILVFASTHTGEETAFIKISQQLQKQIQGLQVILVPRHPERFSEVTNLLVQQHVVFRSYTQQQQHRENCDFLLLDAMGLLMHIYEISDVAVVAGSFTPKVGGHNIFEPAFFSKAIVYGPWIFKQPGFHDLIQEHQAAIQISEVNWQENLTVTLLELLADESKRTALGAAANQIVQNSEGMTDKMLADLAGQIDFLK